MTDLSCSEALTAAVGRMHPWAQRMVTDEQGRLRALPVAATLRPVYWYPAAWAQAGLSEADVPQSFTELLDFLDAWADAPAQGVCVSRLTRFTTGEAQYDYGAWLLEFLITAQEMQQRHAGKTVAFETDAFVSLAERARTTGLALYRAEKHLSSRQGMPQLFQSDLNGGEHANNGSDRGLACTVPRRLTREEPPLTMAAVEAVFLRADSERLTEGRTLLKSMAGETTWFRAYGLYADFQPGTHAAEGSLRTWYVDAGWLAEPAAYEGEIVAYPRALQQIREGISEKNRLVKQFVAGEITARQLAQGLEAAVR